MKWMKGILQLFDRWTKRDHRLRPLSEKREDDWIRWTIAAGLVILLTLMFPKGRSLQFADMKEGSISTRRIVAPFNFEILKTQEEYQLDREAAARNVFPIFIRVANTDRNARQRLDRFFTELEGIREAVVRNPISKSTLKDTLFARYPITVLDTQNQDYLINPDQGFDAQTLTALKNDVGSTIRDILAVGLLGLEKSRMTTPDRRLIVKEEEEEVIYPPESFYDLVDARARAAEILNDVYSHSVPLAQIGTALANFFLRPNLVYDATLHQERIDDALARVPLSSGFVYENEKIVDRNERITPEIRKKLISLATKMAEKGMQEEGIRRYLPFLGRILFVIILLFLLGIYVFLDHPAVLRDTKLVLLVALVLLLVSLITFLSHRLDASVYLVPAALGAMLLAALFDIRFGYAGAAVISVLVGGLWGSEFDLMVVSFFTGVIGVLIFKRLRDRRQLIQAIFYLAGATLIAITAMGFLRFLPFREIFKQWPYGVVTGVLTPIVVYGLLPLIESIFGVTTDFSLLELSNLNHPLLKRLSVQSSGTYHHSIIVGNLAEAAAQAVNANSLLARVGSYYHDIGKVEKPEYFVENQMRGENPHEKLTPRMSALILMNHVKRGLELAEKYKLPAAVKDIIAQHQGTTVMNFFYQKAMNQNGAGDSREEDYRYPGPRPQSKEAAIVMLADVVEAATRTLKDPTHSRLKGLIEDLVDGRFQEGQLDESPLTLRDLEGIKESFLTILAGTFHTRIEYPEKDEKETSTVDEEDTEG